MPGTADIGERLASAKEHASQPFIYPMVAFAAHTGARRSEMLRALLTDVDFDGNGVFVREKKRARGKRTSRRVPLTPALGGVLKEWLAKHPGGRFLFCLGRQVARSKKRSETTGFGAGPTQGKAVHRSRG